MEHIKVSGFVEMAAAIQDKARPILEKIGQLGEIFKLLAIDVMIQKYLLDEITLSYDIKETIVLLISTEQIK